MTLEIRVQRLKSKHFGYVARIKVTTKPNPTELCVQRVSYHRVNYVKHQRLCSQLAVKGNIRLFMYEYNDFQCLDRLCSCKYVKGHEINDIPRLYGFFKPHTRSLAYFKLVGCMTLCLCEL